MEAYQDAVAGAPRIDPKVRAVKQGTFDDLVLKYFASAAFQGLPSPATRQTYRGISEGFCNLRCSKGQRYGEKRVAHLRPEDVEHLFTRKLATPAAANNWLRMLRTLMIAAKSAMANHAMLFSIHAKS